MVRSLFRAGRRSTNFLQGLALFFRSSSRTVLVILLRRRSISSYLVSLQAVSLFPRHRSRVLKSIKVNLWGALVYAIGAWLSDRYKARVAIMLVCAPIGMAGYAILVAWDVPAGVQYFSTYLIATACFLCTGGNIAWLSGNRAPDGKRAASLGIQLTLTNIGGIVVSFHVSGLARRATNIDDRRPARSIKPILHQSSSSAMGGRWDVSPLRGADGGY